MKPLFLSSVAVLICFITLSTIKIYALPATSSTFSGLTPIVSSKNSVFEPLKTIYTPVVPRTLPSLEDEINNLLKNQKGRFSVIVTDVSTSSPKNLVSIDSNEIYLTASLYKLWILAVTYQQYDSSTLDMNKFLSANIPTLYKSFGVSTSYSERKYGGINLSIEQALNRMITVSENDSALLLNNYLGNASMSDFLISNDFADSNMGDDFDSPSTSPNDIALFFTKLYYSELLTPDSTSKVLDLLKQQKLNTKIPALLPKDTVVAHKTGELYGLSHDAGIVYTPNGNFLIVVFTDTKEPLKTNNIISKVARTSYDYYLKYF